MVASKITMISSISNASVMPSRHITPRSKPSKTPILQLHRTDSTTLSYIYHKKTCGSVISHMGRIRRIARLDDEFLKDFKDYSLSLNSYNSSGFNS